MARGGKGTSGPPPCARLDDFFPIPFRDGGAPQPADYSEADVLYATRLGEGPLPQRIRDAIDWERVARPQLF